jgi:multidrug efflux pump subunit AcrA (membrane-fusion protein)
MRSLVEKWAENVWPSFARLRSGLAIKIGSLLVVLAVVVAQFSQAVTQRVADGYSATVLPARIQAARLFSATAGVSGSVVSLSVAPGDRVQAGQELAVIDSFELRAAIEKASQRLTKSQQHMESRHAQDRRTRIYLEQYAAAVAASKPACDLADEADTSNQERMYAHYGARLKQVEQLATQNLATSAEIERSRREDMDALQSLQSARERRLRLQQECTATLAQVRVAKLQLDLHRQTQSDSMESEYEAALAEMTVLTEQQRGARVVAARAGTVLSTAVAVGDRVHAGSALIRIGDISELSVEVPVDAEIAKSVSKGDPVTVRVPTQTPKEIEAKISSIILAPGDDTASYVIRVIIPNPDPRTILAGLEGAVIFRHSGPRAAWNKLPF